MRDPLTDDSRWTTLGALAAYRPENDPRLLALPFFVLDGFRHHYNSDGVRMIVKDEST